MLYSTLHAARCAMELMNAERGFPPARVYAARGGYTVVRSWSVWRGGDLLLSQEWAVRLASASSNI